MILTVPTYAQSPQITLTAPVLNTNVNEGDDFFTTEMNNRIDFDKRRDFMWEERYDENTVNATNGTWSATNLSKGAYVFPLFHGFVGVINMGETGDNFPLNSSKYTLYSSYNTLSSRTTKTMYWTKTQNWPDGSMSIAASRDGIYTPNVFIPHPNGSSVVDVYDLTVYPDWSNEITGIRVDPSTLGEAGTQLQYDWIRVSDPNSAPVVKIKWSSENTVGSKPAVNIFMDDNNSGHDGAFIGRVSFTQTGSTTLGEYDLKTAMLPPGDYYFYVELKNNKATDQTLATSGYSAKLTVNGKPRIKITTPSYTSGVDYAASIVDNPWDMNDDADIVNDYGPVSSNNFINPVYANGTFCAVATNPNPGSQPHSDVRVLFNIDQNNPIETNKFRYLTYEMEVDESNYGNISDKVMDGWVTRAVWYNTSISADGSVTQGHLTYEGRNTYTIDLHQAGILDLNAGLPANTGWQGNNFLENLRIDPLENTVNTKFYLYDVKLTAEPKVMDDTYTIEYESYDHESQSGTVSFYYDTDKIGFNGTLIGTQNVNLGNSGTYTFSTSGINNGSYFIYASVTDASGNNFKFYADVPLIFDKTCQPQNPLTLTGVIPSEAYRALNIETDGRVLSNAEVYILGENSIEINPGFESVLGGELKVDISGCN